jgi:hypothetical protein
MRRRLLGLAVAAAIGPISLTLPSGAAAAGGGGSAGALTHQFPLGTQTLSRSTTAAGGASTTTSHQPSAATPHRPVAAAPATHTSTHTGTSTHGGILALALLGLIGVVIAVALLTRAVIRRSRRVVPRGRHEISPALVPLLSPLFRYDQSRYAWVLRGIGRWFGPVLRLRQPARVRRRSGQIIRSVAPGARWSYEPEPEDDVERAPPPLPIRAQPPVSRARPAPGPSARRHTPREQ